MGVYLIDMHLIGACISLGKYLMGVYLTIYASQECVFYRRISLTGLSRGRASHRLCIS